MAQLQASTVAGTLTTTGNVGIGTANTSAKLWVEGNDIVLNTENSSQAKTLYFRYSNGANVQSDSYLYFSTSGTPTEKMRITAAGAVGIGRTNPSTWLELNNLAVGTFFDEGLKINRGEGFTTQYGIFNNYAGGINIIAVLEGAAAGAGSAINFMRHNAGSGTPTTSMIIGSTGNVGIGTTNPTFSAIPGNTVKGLQIQNIGNDTQASLRLTGHNNTGSPGQATFTELQHAGADLRFDINHNGTAAFTISPSNNVGIGNTTVLGKLDVGLSTNVRRFLVTYDDSIVTIKSSNNSSNPENFRLVGDNIIFNTGTSGSGTEKMRIDSGGNVGIGLTNPSFPLTIYGSSFAASVYQTSATGTGVSNGFYVGHSNSISYVWNYNNFPLVLATNNTERVRITEGGNVGIGTTNPAIKLHVVGTNGAIQIGGSGYTLNPSGMQLGQYVASMGYIQAPSGGRVEIWNGATENIVTFNNDKSSQFYNSVGIGTASPTALLDVYATGTNSGIVANFRRGIDALNEYTYLKVGNSAPAYFGNLLLSDDVAYISRVADPTGGNGLFVQGSGNVGIGTINPIQDLHVYAAGNGDGILIESDPAGTNRAPALKLYPKSSDANERNWAISPYRDVVQSLSIASSNAKGGDPYSSATTRMIIDGISGNVGIGTVTPASRLHVVGSATVNTREVIADFRNSNNDQRIDIRDESSATGQPPGLYAATAGYGLGLYAGGTSAPLILYAGGVTTSEERMRILGTNGNVGIGTATPVARLDIRPTSDGAAGINIGTGGTVSGIINTPANMFISANTGNAQSGQGQIIFGFQRTGTSGGSEVMRIAESGGHVGINNSTPKYSLDVYEGSGIAASFGGTFSPGSFGGIHFGYLETPNTNYRKSALVFERTDNHGQGGNASGRIFFLLNNRASDSATSLADAIMTIDTDSVATQGSARVGIGTTSSVTSPLRVQGGDAMTGGWNKNTMLAATYPVLLFNSLGKYAGIGYDYSAALRIWINAGTEDVTATTPVVNILNTGNVGIGTGDPTRRLDVREGNVQIVANFQNTNTTSARIKFTDANTGAENVNIGATGTSLAMWTNNTVRMTIVSGGNVGIGTDTASSKLRIVGTNSSTVPIVDVVASGTGTYQRGIRLLNAGMNAGDHILISTGYADGSRNMGQFYFYFAGAGSTSNRLSLGLHSVDDVLNIAGTGNVGIGVTNPSAKLHVNGTLRVDDPKSFDTRYTPTTGFEETRIYGNNEDNNLLGLPDNWLGINVSGTAYVIPLYAV